MYVTENTSHSLVVIEPIPVTGFAFAWILRRLTLRLVALKTPHLRELASEIQPSGKALPSLSRPLEYPNLVQMPYGLGVVSYFLRKFYAERETRVDFEQQCIITSERVFFSERKNYIPFDWIDALMMQRKVNWQDSVPVNYYQIMIRVRGRWLRHHLLLFEHMDKGVVEHVLKSVASRMRLA
jgi:hypothetical protein